MSAFDMTWRDHIRLASGLRWRGAVPSLRDYASAHKHAICALLVGLLWALAMTIDYRSQALEQKQRADRLSAEFTACQRGEWAAITEQGDEIGCMPVEINRRPLRKRS